jgi:hypothetical protein
MNHVLIIAYLAIYISTTNAQNASTCSCVAIINPDFKGKVSILSKPNGGIVKQMQHNFSEEDFLMLKIYKDSLNFFYGQISYALTPQKFETGWFQKSKELGTYTRNYASNDTLKLYSQASVKSKIRVRIPYWINRMVTISKCDKDWIYVKINDKGITKEGWLSPDKQCPNPYTTCN